MKIVRLYYGPLEMYVNIMFNQTLKLNKANKEVTLKEAKKMGIKMRTFHQKVK